MKCYLINLDCASERLDWFLKTTRGFDLEITRIAAINGRTLPEPELARWSAHRRGPSALLAEEIGCFLSHRAVWEAVARGDDDWVFVAEDDLHFCAAAGAFFSNDDWRPGDADIVKAETFGDRTEIAARASSRPFGHNLRRLLSYHGGSAGYFLGKAAASRLVGLTERACGLADYILFDPVLGVADSFRRYQLDPAICVQDGRLADESKRKSFESTLELARAAVKNREPTPTEPTRLAKLRRESKRLLTYSTLFVNGARLRRIPFADDWRNRDSRTFGHADDG